MLAAPPPLWKKASAISQRPLQGEKWLIPNKSGAIWRINPSTSATQQHTDSKLFSTAIALFPLVLVIIFLDILLNVTVLLEGEGVKEHRGAEPTFPPVNHHICHLFTPTAPNPHRPPFFCASDMPPVWFCWHRVEKSAEACEHWVTLIRTFY